MIVVTGTSYDKISIQGDIEAEFSGIKADGDLIAFANGVLLSVRLGDADDEGWLIEPVVGRILVGIEHPSGPYEGYGDKATIIGSCNWVACGDQWARSAA